MVVKRRIEGIDVARALASLIMLQGHAYHAWIAPAHHDTASYQFTRLLGTLPLPAFLVLAGAAVTLRVHVAQQRAESARAVRTQLVRRGLSVMLWGYGVNVAYAALDGARDLQTVLRADVLQLIGLSIALSAAVGIRARGAGGPAVSTLFRRTAPLGVLAVLLCPWLTPLGGSIPAGLRYPAALWIDVPGITRMPMVPLFGWLTLGIAVTHHLLRSRSTGELHSQIAGASRGALWRTLLASVAISGLAHAATGAWVRASGEALTRAHPAVWLNAVDLGARGVTVLCVGALLSVSLGAAVRARLAQLGRGTLWIYVLHIPFCYGAPGRALYHKLDMATASLWLLPLAIACCAAVLLRDWASRPAADYLKPRATATGR